MHSEESMKKNSAVGWAASVALHLLLGISFLYIVIDTSLTETEFAEVTFSSFVSGDRLAPSQSITQAAPPRRQSEAAGRQTRLVDLPQRRMLEEEAPTLPQDVRDKVPVEDTVQRTGERVDPVSGVAMESKVKPGTSLPGEKEVKGSRRIDVGEKATSEISTQGIGGTQISQKPYDIRWEGGDREILADPLPGFPDGINREVVLRMRITVLPNGTMGEIIPLQKGDVTLENVTIQALKKWRFNSLEQSAPQVSQNGIITFRFVLK